MNRHSIKQNQIWSSTQERKTPGIKCKRIIETAKEEHLGFQPNLSFFFLLYIFLLSSNIIVDTVQQSQQYKPLDSARLPF